MTLDRMRDRQYCVERQSSVTHWLATALRDEELPDWTAFVAANLLVDGMLATFVAACVDSSIVQMAQRAKKIPPRGGFAPRACRGLAKRLCRSGERQRAALVERLEQTWEQAGRWIGPESDPGLQAALELGMLRLDARAQRRLVSTWLVDLLAGEGVKITLDEPTDWSRWDAGARRWNP
jgi:1,2-phenylacetyl-CoA epoxidase catalytic subunit